MRTRHIIAAITFFIFIDALWIVFFARPFYEKELAINFANKPNALAAIILIYFALIAGLYFFVLVHVGTRQRLKDILLRSVLYGFCVYGIYTLTNYLIFERWSMLMVFADIAWGVTICFLTTLIFSALCRFD